jgi:hypothetical protein
MQTDDDRAVADAVRPREGAAPCPVRWVPLRELRTSFAGLRRGRVGGPRADATWPPLAELPLRVVRVGALSGYEVVDGFKRLERWRDEGATHAPVLVETACDAHDAKRLLLVTNAPRRTVSILDEARVVDALRAEGLGPKAIGKTLGRKPVWVDCRLTLAHGLAEPVARRVDAGRLGPSLAHALVGLALDEQVAVAAAVEREGLRVREGLALVSALRVEPDRRRRAALLAAPRALFEPPPAPRSGLAARLEERLLRAQRALDDLTDLELELAGDLSDAERRRLGALQRAVLARVHTLAQRTAGNAAPGLTCTPRDEDERRDDDERRPADPAAVRPGAGDPLALPRGAAEPGEREHALGEREHAPGVGAAGAGAGSPAVGAGDPDAARCPGADAGGAGEDPGPRVAAPRDAGDRGRGGARSQDRAARPARGRAPGRPDPGGGGRAEPDAA